MVEELSERFFKLVKLKNFSIYLDVPLKSDDRYSLLADKSVTAIGDKMLSDIKEMADPSMRDHHGFIVSPFSATARLKLNSRPELSEFKESRAHLELDLESFKLGISQKQYQTSLEMVDAMDYIRLRYRYRKFRPTVPLSGKANVKLWWNYAIQSVIHDSRGIAYSGKRMVEFVRVSKTYRKLYFEKLTKTSINKDAADKISECETKLDAFNIVLQRQKAEMEAKRLGLLQTANKGGGGWFSGWFSSKKESSPPPATDTSSAASLARQLDATLTPEEKAQLIKSMGLDEESHESTNFPPYYKAATVKLSFRSLEIQCYEKTRENTVLHFALSTITSDLALRANKSLKLTGKFQTMKLTGLNSVTFMEAPATGYGKPAEQSLLSFDVDTKEESSGDQCVKVESQPVAIVYHAATVNRLQLFFKVPPSAKLQAVSEMAANAAQDLKEKSTGFLKTILDDRPFIDLRVKLRGGYVVLPEKGDMTVAKRVMIADLGALAIQAEPKRNSAEVSENFDQLDSAKSSKHQQAVVRELLNSAYNRFSIAIEPIQVLLCDAHDDWQAARQKSQSDLHLLPPLHIRALFGMCVISDPRIPAMSIDTAIHPQSIVIDVRDTRLQSALLLLASIPFAPPPPQPGAVDESVNKEQPHQHMFTKKRSSSTSSSDKALGLERSSKRQAMAQLPSNLEQSGGRPANAKLFAMSFTLNQLTCQLTDSKAQVLLKMTVNQLKFQMNADTYVMSASMAVHSFHFQHQKLTSSPTDRPIHNLVNTAVSLPASASSSGQSLAQQGIAAQPGERNLLTVRFIHADPLGPEFDTTHQRRRVQLFVRIGSIELLLHREAILDVITVANSLAKVAAMGKETEQPEESLPPQSGVHIKKEGSGSLHNSMLSIADEVANKLGGVDFRSRHQLVPPRQRKKPEITHVFIDAKLDRIEAFLRTEHDRYGSMHISGLSTKISTKLLSTTIDSSLQEMAMFSAASSSPQDTRQILVLSACQPSTPNNAALLAKPSSPSNNSEIISATITLFNQPSGGNNAMQEVEQADIVVVAKMAELRLLVLQSFVENIIEYSLGFGESAVDRLKDASAGLANQAKQGIEQIQSDAKKIKLDLAISSPVIIVPRRPDEKESFFAVHLGQFCLRNAFMLRSMNEEEEAIAKARSQMADADNDGEGADQVDGVISDNDAALLNEIMLELSGVKFSRGITENMLEVVEEETSLENKILPLVGPINLNVTLVQNLSSAAVEKSGSAALKFADFKVGIALSTIDIAMCHGDYEMMLDVVEWITLVDFSGGRKKLSTEQIAVAAAVETTAAGGASRSSATEGGQSSIYETAVSHFDPVPEPERFKQRRQRKVMDIVFSMEQANFRLFSGDVESNPNDRSLRYNPKNILAALSVIDIQAAFYVLGSGYKNANVSVADLTIDDCRPSSQKQMRVTRLMECFNQLSAMKINPLVPQKPRKLIAVQFEEVTEKSERVLECNLNNLHACVNAEFVACLANFFIANSKANQKQQQVGNKANNNKSFNTSSVKKNDTSMVAAGAANNKAAVPPHDREATAATSFTTRLVFNLTGPKILLLDDPRAAKPAALSMQLELNSSFILYEQCICGSASMRDLGIYWGAYDNLKSGDTDYAQRILKPFAIDVVLSDTENDDKSHIRKLSVTSQEVSLSVTPPVIRTISVVVNGLSAIGNIGEAETVGKAAEAEGDEGFVKAPENLWEHRSLESFTQVDFIHRSGGVTPDSAYEALDLIDSPRDNLVPASKQSDKGVMLILAEFPCVTVKLSTGSRRKIVPLIKLRSSVNAKASSLSTGELNASVQFDVEIAYYNDQLYIWEPLLEPVECTVPNTHVLYYPSSDHLRHRRAMFNIDLTKSPNPRTTNATLPMSATAASGLDEVDYDDTSIPLLQATTSMTIQTSDMLQLLVSKIGLGVLQAVGDSFSKAYRVEELYSSEQNDVKSLFPVILYNHTDTKFTVRPDSSLICCRIVGQDQQYSSESGQAHPQHINLSPGGFAALDFSTQHSQQQQQQQQEQRPGVLSPTANMMSKAQQAKLLTYENQQCYKFTIYVSF